MRAQDLSKDSLKGRPHRAPFLLPTDRRHVQHLCKPLCQGWIHRKRTHSPPGFLTTTWASLWHALTLSKFRTGSRGSSTSTMPRSASAPRAQVASTHLSLTKVALSKPAHIASERINTAPMAQRAAMRRPATESAALPSWRPNTAAPAPTANAAETTKAATKRPAPALRGAFREGWAMEPGPEPKELQALYKVRHFAGFGASQAAELAREPGARERLSRACSS